MSICYGYYTTTIKSSVSGTVLFEACFISRNDYVATIRCTQFAKLFSKTVGSVLTLEIGVIDPNIYHRRKAELNARYSKQTLTFNTMG